MEKHLAHFETIIQISIGYSVRTTQRHKRTKNNHKNQTIFTLAGTTGVF